MERFAGRVALVTGASSGIGAQVAEDLVRAGVVVVGVARRQQRIADLAARLSGAQGKLHAVPADLSDAKEVRRVYEWIDANLGGVTIVINNAAILSMVPIQDMESTLVEQLISTNVTAVALSCREALLNMKKHNITDGHIININSVAGHSVFNLPLPGVSVSTYSAAKHATVALTKALRIDVLKMPGFKTRVTSISPGGVDTEMLPSEYRGTRPNEGEILRAKDVSNAILYALSCPPCVEIVELTIQATGEVC